MPSATPRHAEGSPALRPPEVDREFQQQRTGLPVSSLGFLLYEVERDPQQDYAHPDESCPRQMDPEGKKGQPNSRNHLLDGPHDGGPSHWRAVARRRIREIIFHRSPRFLENPMSFSAENQTSNAHAGRSGMNHVTAGADDFLVTVAHGRSNLDHITAMLRRWH